MLEGKTLIDTLVFQVVVPKTLTAQQQTLMEQFARDDPDPAPPKV